MTELAGELSEPGFRCWVARDDHGRVVGFAYGFPTPEVPSDGWYRTLRDTVGPDAAEDWLVGQLASRPAGIGSPGGGGYLARGTRARRCPQGPSPGG